MCALEYNCMTSMYNSPHWWDIGTIHHIFSPMWINICWCVAILILILENNAFLRVYKGQFPNWIEYLLWLMNSFWNGVVQKRILFHSRCKFYKCTPALVLYETGSIDYQAKDDIFWKFVPYLNLHCSVFSLVHHYHFFYSMNPT